MNESYIRFFSKSKEKFHKKQAKILYEEKVKTVVNLQKIAFEMNKINKNRKTSKNIRVWEIE